MRDLAYYVGYAICDSYYNNASDKTKAIKEMIELDYNNETDLIAFVEKSGYFDETLNTYKETFENSRPTVVAIEPFENNEQRDLIFGRLQYDKKLPENEDIMYCYPNIYFLLYCLKVGDALQEDEEKNK